MNKTAILIMILTLGSKVFGLFRDITLSFFYGTSYVSDAFLISQMIPMSILEFIGLGLLTGYIPLYESVEKKNGKNSGGVFTNKVVSIVIVLSTLLIIVGLIFTKSIVLVFASGFYGDSLKLAIQFTKISLFTIYFVTLGYVFRGFLQIHGKYLITVITGFPLNIITIIGIIVSAKFNLFFLAYGSLLAIFSQFIILAVFSYKVGYRFEWKWDIKDSYIVNLFQLAIPMMIGISVNQINLIVDRTLASRIAVGGISALNYANRLNFFVQGIFVVSITTVMYPAISKLAATSNINGLKAKVNEAITGVNLLLVPASVGFFIYSKEIIILLFGRGMFDDKAIAMTTSATVFYSIGMLAVGLREVLSRTFYSLQNTKTPMINASIGLVINIILNLVLSKYLGISGLAFATSISAIVTTGLLFVSLTKIIGDYNIKYLLVTFMKIVFASILMAFISRWTFNWLEVRLDSKLALLLGISFGVIAYFISIYLLKIEEINNIVTSFRSKIKG